MGNHNACVIMGIGSVRIKMHDRIIRTLKFVRYVPKLKKNLISLGKLDSLGYNFKSDYGSLKVMKEVAVVMKGVKINALYLL